MLRSSAGLVARLIGAGVVVVLGCGGGSGGVPSGTGGSGGGSAHLAGDLRQAATVAGKRLGAAVDATPLTGDATYAQLLGAEWNAVTPENATKWAVLAPSPTTYDWTAADAIVDFAAAHGQEVKGHTLVWHQQTPSWVTSTMTADELGAALKRHIEATLEHFRGRIRSWDVVNEAINADTASGYTESIFWQKLGARYVEDAFRWARAADPDVQLLYNEIGIERAGRKSDLAYALMRDLLANGTPIDGIGLQSHVSIHRYPAEGDLRANIRRFAALGLEVNISELDARTTLMPGTRDARWQAQRLAFQQVVGACIVEPGCVSITFWGFTDRYSWINTADMPDEPLLFDGQYVPKPGHDGTLDGLAGRLPRRGENQLANGDFAAGDQGWAASGGVMAVGAADGRDGSAACVSGRTEASHGLVQAGLLPRLSTGGPMSFIARVRVRGATTAPVSAELVTARQGADPQVLSVATGPAGDGGWFDLAGTIGLGFDGTPTAIELRLGGPPAGVELCVAAVELRPLTAN